MFAPSLVSEKNKVREGQKVRSSVVRQSRDAVDSGARVSRAEDHADARVGAFCDRNLAAGGLMTREGARDSAGGRGRLAKGSKAERDRRACR